MHLGFVRVRSSWKLMFGALGTLTNRNKGYTAGARKMTGVNVFQINKKEWWRRGESNPRPKSATARSLHA